MYPDYLIHFNKNHSSKNGQFTSGDGDGDGIANDHAYAGKSKGTSLARKVSNFGSSSSSSRTSLRPQHNSETLRSINTSKLKSSGKSFVDDLGDNWVDGAKASQTEEGHVYLSRNVGMAVIDILDNEDEEEKKKRKRKIVEDTAAYDYSKYRKPGSSRNDKAAQLGNEAWEKDTAPYRRR